MLMIWWYESVVDKYGHKNYEKYDDNEVHAQMMITKQPDLQCSAD